MTIPLQGAPEPYPGPRRALVVSAAALIGFVLVIGAFGIRDRVAGDQFDLVRWERSAIWGKWLFHAGSPLRDDPDHDEAIQQYFALADRHSPDSRDLENVVERAIEGRIDAVLTEMGLSARIQLPGSVFPPVAIELTAPPRVLVESPRSEIRRVNVQLLRPDLGSERLLAIEERAEARSPDRSALIVGSGGVATYPAIVAPSRTYRSTVETAAHEWVHHYLAFYPLGMRYFTSSDLTTINETVADVIGNEIADLVIERFGDPTVMPASTIAPASAAPIDTALYFDTLHGLRMDVDSLLALGRVDAAEARMAEVRDELEMAGIVFRRINQAFFAWTGSYAARPDTVDPLGNQIREVRGRADSLREFVEVIRNVTSRGDVEKMVLD